MATELTAEQELAMQARDERVRAKVTAALSRWREEAREARQTAAELERAARETEADVLAGRWWKLAGLIGSADAGSLAEIEASDRSEYLGDASMGQ